MNIIGSKEKKPIISLRDFDIVYVFEKVRKSVDSTSANLKIKKETRKIALRDAPYFCWFLYCDNTALW